MKEIDFLPATYREQNAVHKARLWRLVMALSFGAVITVAICCQFGQYRFAKLELNSIAAQHNEAITTQTRLAAMQADVDQAREFAELYTYLNYPWPRTQFLAEITRNLPPQVTLRELTIMDESPRTVAHRGVIAVEVAGAQTAAKPPAVADLELLREEQDRTQPQIQISGTTTDSGALHLFVMALHGTPLIESAKLHSLETVAGSEPAESNFFIRLLVRPGYGQPNGPSGPQTIAAQHSATGSRERS